PDDVDVDWREDAPDDTVFDDGGGEPDDVVFDDRGDEPDDVDVDWREEAPDDTVFDDGGGEPDDVVFDDRDDEPESLLLSNTNLDFSNLPDLDSEHEESPALDSSEAQPIDLTMNDVLDMTGSDHVLPATGGEGDQMPQGTDKSTPDQPSNNEGDGFVAGGSDPVQIVSIDDTDNTIKSFTDDGTPIG
ncbi:MAG: hypothetical protein GY737_22255, partial [Desulfobacteraceae bacterium]|nr:hypothetical protein [Desulfobacteraceae bacterium]